MGRVLLDMGHRVEVACLDAPGEPFLQEFPLPTHPLGPSSLGNYRYTKTLVPWLKAHAPSFDAVIVDGLWLYPGFGTWRALKKAKTPYFVFTHGMNDPWFKYTYPLKHLKKWLYWPWAEYRVLRDAAAVIFTCEEERLLSRKSFWLYRCHEEVSAFGTRLPPQNASELKAAFFQKHPQLAGKRIILFLGRLHEKKGCDLLVQAFVDLAKDAPDVNLILAGPDDHGLVQSFLDLAGQHGLSHRVTWLGMLNGPDKWAAFHAADVFALPSHQENFGIAVAEAMGCHKPVLISNKVNIWREIEAGGGGFVADDTLAGTKTLLTRWLALTAAESEAMGARAFQTFQEKFTAEAMAESLLRIVRRHAR